MNIRMLESKKTLLNHFKALRLAWQNITDKIYLDCFSFKVFIQYQDELIVLYPQFASWDDHQRTQTWTFTNDVQRFLGWRPYGIKEIPIFSDKLSFKIWMKQHKISTPEFSDQPTIMKPVLLKHRRSAFGHGVHGPYRTSKACSHKINDNFYFENFIEGKICKLWYLNERPICMEIQAMAKLVGNGHDTIETLINNHTALLDTEPPWESILQVLEYYGLKKDTVLDDQQMQLIDFRYGSPLSRPLTTIELKCNAKMQPLQWDQLLKVGQLIKSNLLNDDICPLFYTLDGIITSNYNIWFLEANANPFIHPRCYNLMASELCHYKSS